MSKQMKKLPTEKSSPRSNSHIWLWKFDSSAMEKVKQKILSQYKSQKHSKQISRAHSCSIHAASQLNNVKRVRNLSCINKFKIVPKKQEKEIKKKEKQLITNAVIPMCNTLPCKNLAREVNKQSINIRPETRETPFNKINDDLTITLGNHISYAKNQKILRIFKAETRKPLKFRRGHSNPNISRAPTPEKIISNQLKLIKKQEVVDKDLNINNRYTEVLDYVPKLTEENINHTLVDRVIIKGNKIREPNNCSKSTSRRCLNLSMKSSVELNNNINQLIYNHRLRKSGRKRSQTNPESPRIEGEYSEYLNNLHRKGIWERSKTANAGQRQHMTYQTQNPNIPRETLNITLGTSLSKISSRSTEFRKFYNTATILRSGEDKEKQKPAPDTEHNIQRRKTEWNRGRTPEGKNVSFTKCKNYIKFKNSYERLMDGLKPEVKSKINQTHTDVKSTPTGYYRKSRLSDFVVVNKYKKYMQRNKEERELELSRKGKMEEFGDRYWYQTERQQKDIINIKGRGFNEVHKVVPETNEKSKDSSRVIRSFGNHDWNILKGDKKLQSMYLDRFMTQCSYAVKRKITK